jgi:hypothetical protein
MMKIVKFAMNEEIHHFWPGLLQPRKVESVERREEEERDKKVMNLFRTPVDMRVLSL